MRHASAQVQIAAFKIDPGLFLDFRKNSAAPEIAPEAITWLLEYGIPDLKSPEYMLRELCTTCGDKFTSDQQLTAVILDIAALNYFPNPDWATLHFVCSHDVKEFKYIYRSKHDQWSTETLALADFLIAQYDKEKRD